MAEYKAGQMWGFGDQDYWKRLILDVVDGVVYYRAPIANNAATREIRLEQFDSWVKGGDAGGRTRRLLRDFEKIEKAQATEG